MVIVKYAIEGKERVDNNINISIEFWAIRYFKYHKSWEEEKKITAKIVIEDASWKRLNCSASIYFHYYSIQCKSAFVLYE